MTTKRIEDRIQTLLAGRIMFANGAIDCVVRDISQKGARLRVPDAKAVPQTFELNIKQHAITRPATVRWRRKTEVGVSFMPERRVFGRRLTPPAPTKTPN